MNKNIKKILIGILAGLINGFFSTGGGLIIVPALMYILKKDSKVARTTSIFCILPIVITSSIFYQKEKYIEINTAILCSIGGIIGGIIGTKILKKVDEKKIRILYIIFLIYISFKMIIN